MKSKICVSIILFIMLIFSLHNLTCVEASVSDVVNKTTPEDSMVKVDSNFKKIINKIIGLIQWLTGILSVIMISYTGFNMLTEPPEGKVKLREKLFPMVLGIIIAFSSVTIIKFVIGIFE